MFNRPDLCITEYEDIPQDKEGRFISFAGCGQTYWVLPKHGGVPYRRGWTRDNIYILKNRVRDLIWAATTKATENAQAEFARQGLPQEDY